MGNGADEAGVQISYLTVCMSGFMVMTGPKVTELRLERPMLMVPVMSSLPIVCIT